MMNAIMRKSFSTSLTFDEDDENIWASVLEEVRLSTKKIPLSYNLLVLGDNESGRSTLISRLQNSQEQKFGYGLEFHYIDVKDEDEKEDNAKLGIWVLDGDGSCASLLSHAVNDSNLEQCILVLVTSLSAPWDMLKSLNSWVTVFERHLGTLNDKVVKQAQDRLLEKFKNEAVTIENGSSSAPVVHDSEVLSKNLGVPVIVVVTKADCIMPLMKQQDYIDDHFDFIEMHLRKFCLQYGAALIYTSDKDSKNMDVLYRYVLHLCYGYSFTYEPSLLEHETLFIPRGWDSPNKIGVLAQNMNNIDPTQKYEDVVYEPVVSKPLASSDSLEVKAEDDQEFLSRIQLRLNRSSGSTKPDETPRKSHQSQDGRSSPAAAINSATKKGATNDVTLANFFHSLLNKKSPSPAVKTQISDSVDEKVSHLGHSASSPSLPETHSP